MPSSINVETRQMDEQIRDTEEKIRERAHELWEQDGSSSGTGIEYCLRAEREINGGSAADADAALTETDGPPSQAQPPLDAEPAPTKQRSA